MTSINHCKTLPVAKLDLNNHKKESQDKSYHGPCASWGEKNKNLEGPESSAIPQKGTKVAKTFPRASESQNITQQKLP